MLFCFVFTTTQFAHSYFSMHFLPGPVCFGTYIQTFPRKVVYSSKIFVVVGRGLVGFYMLLLLGRSSGEVAHPVWAKNPTLFRARKFIVLCNSVLCRMASLVCHRSWVRHYGRIRSGPPMPNTTNIIIPVPGGV
jgi:hypothetical protein